MAGKKIVMAIDDNLQQLSEFMTILGERYELRVVKSASEAIALLNRSISDIILLDIEMPNISGFEFLKDIKRIPSYINVPVIVVSGNSGKEFFDQARAGGAEAVLTKPVKADTLILTIEKVLSEQQGSGGQK